MSYERRIEATPAYDYRPTGGIHGVELFFALVSDIAAIRWSVSTGWLLPSTIGLHDGALRDYRRKLAERDEYPAGHPLPMGVYYHTAEQVNGASGPSPCDLMANGLCYHDVTYLGGDKHLIALVENGLDGLWASLEADLTDHLNGDTR